MCLKIYYEHSKGSPGPLHSEGSYYEYFRARIPVLSPVLRGSQVPFKSPSKGEFRARNTRSNVFLDVKACLKRVFRPLGLHGKSPCFSHLGFLTTADVDVGVLIFMVANGGFFLE
jgi:hypothetical protein